MSHSPWFTFPTGATVSCTRSDASALSWPQGVPPQTLLSFPGAGGPPCLQHHLELCALSVLRPAPQRRHRERSKSWVEEKLRCLYLMGSVGAGATQWKEEDDSLLSTTGDSSDFSAITECQG